VRLANDLGAYVGVRCDTCPTEAPPALELLKAGGLIALGWHCAGGSHFCPACPHPTAAPCDISNALDTSETRASR
jgi:hypothetical protein